MNAAQIAKQLYSGATRAGEGWLTRCPCHNDHKPSLSIKDGRNDMPVVHCFTGCDTKSIYAELRQRGMVEDKKRMKIPKIHSGLTVKELATKKRLNVDLLRSLGIEDSEKFSSLMVEAQQKAERIDPEEYCQIEPKIAELNKKHAVTMVGGKCCILNECIDPTTGHPSISFSNIQSFKDFYSNKKIFTGRQNVGLGNYWITHPDRRQYEGVTFAPGQNVKGYYNLWQGFAVKPKEGNCSTYLRHIQEVIASGEPTVFEYILNWLADLVQNPADKPGISIVMRGRQGTGKGVFVSQLLKILEPHMLHVTHPKRLTGGFNNHLRDALLVFCDEGFWAGDKAAEGVLKALVTEETFAIEPKGKDVFIVRNYVHLIIATNNSWACPAGLEERRFFTLDVSAKRTQDIEYFKKITNEMDNGGREALLYFLLNRDISGVNLRKFPTTTALLEQKHYSMSTVQKFWFDILMQGALSMYRGDWNSGEIPKDELHDSFCEFSGKTGQRHRETSTELGMGLRKITEVKSTRRNLNSKRTNFYQFPSLKKCRELFEDKLRQKVDWSENE